ncbi:MAG: hypothetical protein ABSC38_07100 [Verrucomicrobiia bacterium]
MKQVVKLVAVIAVAVSIGLLAPQITLAAAGYHGGYNSGNGGWFHGGYWGGYHRGYWGGYRGGYWGGPWYPWAFSFSYYDAPYYYDYYSPPVYYYPPPAYYYSPPVVESSTSPSPVIQNSQPVQRSNQDQPGSVSDIKALAKAGLSDTVILSQIRNSRTIYRLSTAEIIDLKTNNVSETVIDFMINTSSRPDLKP